MSAPIRLKAGELAGREHLAPNDYFEQNAKWRVENAFITAVLIPQHAADWAKKMAADADLTAYAASAWNSVNNELKAYCGGDERENTGILDKARHGDFGRESPTSGAVTRNLILFWIAALCEATVFVIQGVFSGGFNPVIILLAALLAFGGFLTGVALGRMLYSGWHNNFLGEPYPISGIVWFQLVLGCILMISVGSFRAYGAGELVPGIFAFLITILLGSLCALFETLHQLAKLKREECLLREGDAQRWTAYETHKLNLPEYRNLFIDELRQRIGVGGNITANSQVASDRFVTLVTPSKAEA